MVDKVLCPNCGSDQLAANKKGFSGTNAVAGAVLAGGLGLLAGMIGSNAVKITCIACGYSWIPEEVAAKKEQERRLLEIQKEKNWKMKFYSLYQSGSHEEAEAHYKRNTQLSGRTPGFHDGYRFLRKSDGQRDIVIGIVIFIVLGGIFFLVW